MSRDLVERALPCRERLGGGVCVCVCVFVCVNKHTSKYEAQDNVVRGISTASSTVMYCILTVCSQTFDSKRKWHFVSIRGF